jgi:hypothetical protein
MTSDLLDELRDAEVDLALVTVLESHVSPSSTTPDTWIVREVAPDLWWVGGADRGRFVPYDVYEGRPLLVNALKHLTLAVLETAEITPARAQAAADASKQLDRQIRDASPSTKLGPLPAGLLLDRLGPEQGHSLFLYQTPFPERSSPPTDLQQPYHAYITLRELPPSAIYGQIAPWFGQPGGGVMVSLDRVVRWYYDAGFLDEVTLPSPS